MILLSRMLPFLALFSFSLLAYGQETSPSAELAKPRVLVSNDDGWSSKGLSALVAELSIFCEVVVCAPAENQSGKSHASEIFGKQLSATQIEVEGAQVAWALTGTPADAVAFGLLQLGKEKPFDCVVTGINAGANVGEISHYSGTVGAAMEAAGRGYPAVAVSQQARSGFKQSASFAGRFLRKLLAEGPGIGVVYSINVPPLKEGVSPPVVFAPMGGRYLRIKGFTSGEQEGETMPVRAKLDFLSPIAPEGSDTRAFLQGAITVTPLAWDWTHANSLVRLKSWDTEWSE